MQRHDTTSSGSDRRWIRRLVVVAMTLAVAIPTAAWAGHQFTDVPNSNIFHEDIAWMAAEGVTVGCNPPANTEYCPDDFVTREQMAAFMHRLETKNVFLPADGQASDADTVDGLDSTALLPRFAVIEYVGPGAQVNAHRGLVFWQRESTGMYKLRFDRDVLGCAWTGTAGGRDDSILADGVSYTVHIQSVLGEPDTVRVQIHNQDDNNEDTDFNVAINC